MFQAERNECGSIEECDDGNHQNGDDCDANCKLNIVR
jgi:hypothetical protein